MAATALLMTLWGCGSTAGTETTQATTAAAATEAAKESAAKESTQAEASQENTAEAENFETAWPERAVSIVVGANPGGGQDAVARLYAQYLTEATGQAFNVVNVTGGNGSIASTQVKDSAPDGYNMLCMHEAILSNQINGLTDYGANAFELAGIGIISRSVALVCNGNHFTNMDELAAYAKENPGAVVAATEWGGTTHQALLSLADGLGIEISIVDGGSVGERISGIVGGIYDMTVTPLGNVSDYITNGSMLPILMFNDEVYDAYKDIPIGSDYNVDYVFDKFFGLYFPKGTDQNIVLKCRSLLKEISQKPEFVEAVEKMDFVVEYIDDASVLEAAAQKLAGYGEKYPIE